MSAEQKPSVADTGEVPGHGLPDWPEWCNTFELRRAYQQGIADARAIGLAPNPVGFVARLLSGSEVFARTENFYPNAVPVFTAAPKAAPKDHELRELVNRLRGIAIEFHNSQQLRERIAAEILPMRDALPAPKALHLSVGESSFESWYESYCPAHKSDKQRARDAYAAGMEDPLVKPTP